MSLVDNGNRWVGIIDSQKCCNCYFAGTLCLNCSDTDYDDLTFGLMSFQEFKDASIKEYKNQTYSEFNAKYTKEIIDLFMLRSQGEEEVGEEEVMRYFSDWCDLDRYDYEDYYESDLESDVDSTYGYNMNDL